jgi:hypothetical protein
MNTYSGLDVHKGSVFVCIIDEKREKIFEKRFGTLTLDLQKLRDMLLKYGVKGVALESTSIYWMSSMAHLATSFFDEISQPIFHQTIVGTQE